MFPPVMNAPSRIATHCARGGSVYNFKSLLALPLSNFSVSSAESGSVLIKCNASDLISGDEQAFTPGKEKGVELARGEEAFVWVSENPGRGCGPKGNGLTV